MTKVTIDNSQQRMVERRLVLNALAAQYEPREMIVDNGAAAKIFQGARRLAAGGGGGGYRAITKSNLGLGGKASAMAGRAVGQVQGAAGKAGRAIASSKMGQKIGRAGKVAKIQGQRGMLRAGKAGKAVKSGAVAGGQWMKKNPGKTAAMIGGGAAVGGAGAALAARRNRD
jgi:hypothetical protein